MKLLSHWALFLATFLLGGFVLANWHAWVPNAQADRTPPRPEGTSARSTSVVTMTATRRPAPTRRGPAVVKVPPRAVQVEGFRPIPAVYRPATRRAQRRRQTD